MGAPASPPDPYLFGHSDSETRRLQLQAAILDASTSRMMATAGLAPGMRVLDVGSGAGDVALLAAQIVGPTGRVVGLERNPELASLAQARATAAGASTVRFECADIAAWSTADVFDALVGRCVLFFLADPAAVLRDLLRAVRPGGTVAFQEPGNAALPPAVSTRCPTLERMWSWILEVYRRKGMDLHMGLRLHRVFLDAGLPAPTMHLDAAVGGGPQWPGFAYMAELVRTLLPLITQLGVATEGDVDIDTLADRLRREVGETGDAATTWSFISAWSAHAS
jgi:SAM-dependent methyltransferase